MHVQLPVHAAGGRRSDNGGRVVLALGIAIAEGVIAAVLACLVLLAGLVYRENRGRGRAGSVPPVPEAAPAPEGELELPGWQRKLLAQMLHHADEFLPAAITHGRLLADSVRRQAEDVGDVGDIELARIVLTIVDYLDDVISEICPELAAQPAVIGQILGIAAIEMTAADRASTAAL